jgi:Lrp/AsnC family transcriptional regulator, leucine-responsive regulatory protein
MAHQNLALDPIDWKIVEALQDDARLSYAEIGRRVGLSTPAAAERVRRIEDAGVITGYHAEVNYAKLGLTMCVVVRLSVAGGENPLLRAVKAAKSFPEILECHRVTGSDSFILVAQVRSIEHLEFLINRLNPLGTTTTSTVLSSPIRRRTIRKKDLE